MTSGFLSRSETDSQGESTLVLMRKGIRLCLSSSTLNPLCTLEGTDFIQLGSAICHNNQQARLCGEANEFLLLNMQ